MENLTDLNAWMDAEYFNGMKTSGYARKTSADRIARQSAELERRRVAFLADNPSYNEMDPFSMFE